MQNNESVRSRIKWIDISKGITILLMVLGHSGIPLSWNAWIFSFHMPFFFIISGLTTSKKTFNEFILSKARSLLIPFMVYSLIMLALLTLFYHGKYDYLRWLSNGWGDIALWFVPILFIGQVTTYFIIRNKVQWITIGILTLIAWILAKYNIQLPWTLSTIPIAIVFIFAGFKCKDFVYNKIVNSSKYKKLLVIIICFIITALVSRVHVTDLAHNNILPISVTLIAAFAGFIMIICISQMLASIPFIGKCIAKIGMETFVIMAFSQIIIMFENKYLDIHFIEKYVLLAVVIVSITYIKNFLLITLKK